MSHSGFPDSIFDFIVAQREAAIVTHIPGTTRDILELSLDIGGLPIIVVDTAGLRKSGDVVEQIGIQRATKAYVFCFHKANIYSSNCSVQEADIKLCVLSLPDLLKVQNQPPLPEAVRSLTDPQTLFLFNKADLASNFREKDTVNTALARLHADSSSPPRQAWVTSLATGDGTQEFITGLATTLKHRFVPC